MDAHIRPGLTLRQDDFATALLLILNLVVAGEFFEHLRWRQALAKHHFLPVLAH